MRRCDSPTGLRVRPGAVMGAGLTWKNMEGSRPVIAPLSTQDTERKAWAILVAASLLLPPD